MSESRSLFDAREARRRAEQFLARDRAMGIMSLSLTAEALARDVLALLDATDEARERLNDGDPMGAHLVMGWPT